MTNYDELINIIDRIATGKQTEADIAVLRQLLSADDRQIATQLGKYNVNITEGKDIHIGDRIYYTWDDEALHALVCMIRFGESIKPKIREKQDYYQDKIHDIKHQESNRLEQLDRDYRNDLMRLEADYKENFMKIEIECRNNRDEKIDRIISDLRQQKSDLESRFVKDGFFQEGGDTYEKYRSLINDIDALSQRRFDSLSGSIKKQIDDFDEFFENKKVELNRNINIWRKELESNLTKDQTETEANAEAEIQRIEKNGREEIYIFILQFYLTKEGYPFSPDSLRELEQFQLELKMPKEEIETIEKLETKPVYQKNLDKYKEEFTKLINEEGYPLTPETTAKLKQTQESLGLRNPDIVSAEKPIIKPLYQKNLDKYQGEFIDLMNKEGYPLSPETTAKLEKMQKSLGLKNLDIISAQEPIIKPLYQKNLDKYQGEFIELMNEKVNALTEQSLVNLRNKKDLLGLNSEDVEAIEQLIVKQFYQISLDKYEEEFTEFINKEGYHFSPENIANLKQRQELLRIKLLGFNREDIVVVKRIIDNSKDKNKVIDYLSSDSFKKDYQKLRDLLASNQWKEANEETKDILFRLAEITKKEITKITEPQIRMIDILQIEIIDMLWNVYSKGKFSFHKQRDIFITVGKDYKTFSENIGWKKRVFFLLDFLSWKSEDKIMFSIDAPEGHLPFWRYYIINPEHFLINLIDSNLNP
jgi:Effector-associated domain 10/GUN4-like